jgi:hypothetical protein
MNILFFPTLSNSLILPWWRRASSPLKKQPAVSSMIGEKTNMMIIIFFSLARQYALAGVKILAKKC